MACKQTGIRMGEARLPRIAVVALIATLGVLFCRAGEASAATNCSAGSTMTIVAHEDDSLLFLSPDLMHAIQGGLCIRTVFVTAGDAGQGLGLLVTRARRASRPRTPRWPAWPIPGRRPTQASPGTRSR